MFSVHRFELVEAWLSNAMSALSSCGPARINSLHDPLRENNGIRDDRMQRRGRPGAFQLTELPCSQNRRCDQENALAAFVHARHRTTFRLAFAREAVLLWTVRGCPVDKNKFRHFFERFVTDFGGEVLAEVHSVPYADFRFRGDQIVSELKTLEEDRSGDHARKLQALAWDWQRRGLVTAFGTVQLSLPQLPQQCQREWLNVLEPPVEHLIRDANRQIRSTKEHLKLEGYKGLLLIANDGNFLHTDPTNYMILVSRVLKKRKDGKPRFPHIDGVCYFSYRVGTKDEGMPFWVSGIVAQSDPIMSAFQKKLSSGWFAYLAKVTRQPVMEFSKNEIDQLGLTRVRVEISGRIEGDQHIVSAQVFCQKDGCGKAINLVSDGPDTRQWVECPAHGAIGSFENLAEYEKTLRDVVNRTTAERALQGIDPDAVGQIRNAGSGRFAKEQE
jgi:hypothetical protein